MKLRPMTEDEFREWQVRGVESYAADIARATGMPVEAARQRAHRQDAQLLPEGNNTANHSIMIICDDSGASVGTLWIGPHPERPDVAFIYNIEIEESRRNQGFGRAAMIAAEELVTATGRHEIGLSVFGFNDRAQHLYASLGYGVVAIQMTKQLTAGLAGGDGGP